MTGLVLASGDELLEARLNRALTGSPLAPIQRWLAPELLDRPTPAAAHLASVGAHVVAVGPDVPVDHALALLRALDANHPELTAMLIAEPTPQLLEHALRTGVREVVSPTSGDDELRRAVARVVEAAERRRALLSTRAEPARVSKVICVVSAKGGSGKTTVATNLAVGLARLAPGDVAIADLDVQFGDVASALHLTPTGSLLEAARTGERLDSTSLKAFLVAHGDQLYALCAPEEPGDADEIAATHTSRAVSLLADLFTYVVVDTGAGIDEHTLAALDLATDVVLVTSTDVPSVRAARKELQALTRLGMTGRRLHLVLNRADAAVGLDADDIALTIGARVDVTVPSSRAVTVSLNQGVPLLSTDDRSPVARGLRSLVDRVADVPLATPARRRFRLGKTDGPLAAVATRSMA